MGGEEMGKDRHSATPNFVSNVRPWKVYNAICTKETDYLKVIIAFGSVWVNIPANAQFNFDYRLDGL